MEIEDCASPYLVSVTCGTDIKEGFVDANMIDMLDVQTQVSKVEIILDQLSRCVLLRVPTNSLLNMARNSILLILYTYLLTFL